MEPIRTEIYHQHYNLEGKDNLEKLPAQPAIYGLFAIIDGAPVHCRHVGCCRDLQAAIRRHFESESQPGLRTFMQGPWIKMLVYSLESSARPEPQLQTKLKQWQGQYDPFCDDAGEYRWEEETANA